MKRGRFITFEGQDGSGKTTNMEVAIECLRAHQIDFLQTREPGGTPFAEKIRDLILNSNDDKFGDLAELLLMFAARADHVETVIQPALEAGKWVICDRFVDATYAYQGGGRYFDFADIATLEKLVLNGLKPDLTVLLDVPIETGNSRAVNRGPADRFESQAMEFKQRVRETYLDIAQKELGRVVKIDASLSLNAVSKEVKSCIESFVRENL